MIDEENKIYIHDESFYSFFFVMPRSRSRSPNPRGELINLDI